MTNPAESNTDNTPTQSEEQPEEQSADQMPTGPSFADLGLSEPLLKAVTSLGYEQPSPIQAEAIPHLLEGKSLLGVAQTGTGKTAAFALPLLSRIEPNQKKPQVLVLTPTRELAIQVAEAFQTYARHLKNFHVAPIYGGQDIRGQLKLLKRGADVVVGTPGRLLDHLRRRSLLLDGLQAVVLDEADEMLRMGFIDDIETILSQAPEESQRALFSATMPAPIRRVAAKYLKDAEEVRIATKSRTVEKIDQSYLIVHYSHKLDTLTRILEVENFDGMIVFVRTKSESTELTSKLEARGFSAVALNGDLNQNVREKTIDRFKRGGIDILVATDVAARGLDVDRISHVINYDIPYDPEAYVHRIGRTGRAGREGKAILFVTPKERRLLRTIEKANRLELKVMPMPTGEQVSEQRIAKFQTDLLQTMQSEDLSTFRELVERIAHDTETDIGEIAAALVMQSQKQRPLYPKFAPLPDASKRSDRGQRDTGRERSNRRQPARDGGNRRDSSERGDRPPSRRRTPREPDADQQRYRIEAGKSHGIRPGDIVGALANEAGVEVEFIGSIEINDDHSTVDLPEGMPKDVFEHLKRVRVRQQPMNISLVSGSASAGPGNPEKSRKPNKKLSLKKNRPS